MASKYTTRGSASHSIFGPPLPELSIFQLSTRGDVGRHLLFLKENKYASNKEVLPVSSQLLTDLWNTASIPPQSLKCVKNKLSRLMQEGSQASRHEKLAAKSTRFQNSINDLFDISYCQCKEFTSCQCVKEKKVPRAEQEFFRDQRSSRKM